MSRELTAIKYCSWCGDPFEMKSPNQKYCPSDIKDCSKEAKRESWRKAAYKYRKKYKDVLAISQVYKLGSGWLSSTPNNDYNAEHLAIQKEKKRLKINTLIAGACLWAQMNSQFFMRNVLKFERISIDDFWPQIVVLIILIIAVLFLGNNSQ
jgi:hypothetical protein